ncbi:hypothetical protein BCR44DRAFT_1437055 [Catenaria anguillulae PL171]|uniref:Uncharacterized protein n=1 Tax=Catenaria anguillulae PL171 TaxID=765915 RepID=A0A1Y2HHL1_9FUNG|nr:hypothetical protein BCR44DRAFT_1437055 [Catenaria anguillulae PL171]
MTANTNTNGLDVDMTHLESALAAVTVPEDRLREVDTLPEDKLRTCLKDAYAALAAKERDLLLAAEIGQSLLDANNDLRAALTESESSAPARLAAKARARLAESMDAAGHHAGDDEILAKLEQHNQDLESRVAQLELDLRDSRNAHRRDVKNLEVDLDREVKRAEALETRLADALATKEKLARDNVELKVKLAGGNRSEDSLDSLQDELLTLRGERDALTEANAQLADQLTVAVTKADDIRTQLLDSDKQLKEFADLQESYKHQARHIIELRELVDDLRMRLAKVNGQADMEPGVSSIRSTWSSEVAAENSATSLISELEQAWVKEHGEPKTAFSGLLDSMRNLLIN